MSKPYPTAPSAPAGDFYPSQSQYPQPAYQTQYPYQQPYVRMSGVQYPQPTYQTQYPYQQPYAQPGQPEAYGAPPPYSAQPQQGPPPAYSQYPTHAAPAPQPAMPPHTGYPQYTAPHPAMPPQTGYPQQQVHMAPGLYDNGARFDGIAQPRIPPPPPGVAPNAAQMASMQGHQVVGTQAGSNWFSGGRDNGGSTFW